MVITTGNDTLSLSSHVGRIKDIPDDDMNTINELFTVWRDKYPRNLLRSAYYGARERFNDFKVSIPPQIAQRAQATIGWAEKSVRALADKSVFEGFLIPDNDPYGIQDLVDANNLRVDVSQAITSAYTHSCSFLTVYEDETSGQVMLMPRSADWSSAIWDRARRRIAAALTITGDDKNGNITAFTAWLPGRNYECRRVDGKWTATLQETHIDRPCVVPFVYDAQMDRPFGHSRISRVLMNLTDMAFRTMVRMESTAEFYSYPQLWFLGLSEDATNTDSWKIAINSINSISRDQEGFVPTMQQVQQASMTPHGSMLETIVMQVSAVTDLSPETLGVRMSNPTSAEALAASESWLTRTANRQNIAFGKALTEAITMAAMLRSKNPNAEADLRGLQAMWAPTREVSDAARADYFAKIASVNASFADSIVGLRKAGLSLDEIQQLRYDQREQRAQAYVDQLNARIDQQRGNVNDSEEKSN